ncbi:MAG: LysR substrate-binding domain-containing protein [Alsobacter sp.]
MADDRIDLAVAPSGLKPPDGIDREALGALSWQCFMRREHPAAADWGTAAWSRWPHLMVNVGNRLQSPVHAATADARVERRVGAVVPNFAAVPPVLAATDLLATLPTAVMGDGLAHYDLVARPVPFRVPPIPHSLFWSARRANDPAVLWLRKALTPLRRAGLA